jgi:prepilin-type processing-associated H-X9-DG protein
MILPALEQSTLYSRIDFELPTGEQGNADLLQLGISAWRCPSDSASPVITGSPSLPMLRSSTGNYCGSSGFRGAGLPGILYELSDVRHADIADGTSNTLMLGERLNQSDFGAGGVTSGWYGEVVTGGKFLPQSIPYLDVIAFVQINDPGGAPACFSSRHTGGAQFAFCDGSVRFLNQYINADVYQALGTRAGAEAVEF